MGEVVKIHEDAPDIAPVETHHQMLLDMSRSNELEHYQIVCHWKNGTTTTGWSTGIRSHVMSFGIMTLDEATRRAIYSTGE